MYQDYAPKPPTVPPAPRRTGNAGKILLLIILVLILASMILITAVGFMPGASALVGTSKARNLGVTATQGDYDSAVAKVGYKVVNPPTLTQAEDFTKVYTGQAKIDQTFTDAELSALFSFGHVPWWLVEGVQVKTHADGTTEASGILHIDRVNWAEAPGSIVRHLPKILPSEAPFYVKGRIDVINPTQVKLSIQRLELGRIPLPSGILSTENQQRATDWANDWIKRIPGFAIQELGFGDGKLQFKGTVPKELKRVPAGQ